MEWKWLDKCKKFYLAVQHIFVSCIEEGGFLAVLLATVIAKVEEIRGDEVQASNNQVDSEKHKITWSHSSLDCGLICFICFSLPDKISLSLCRQVHYLLYQLIRISKGIYTFSRVIVALYC